MHILRRYPDVRLDNQQETLNWHLENPPSETLTVLGQWAMSHIVRPRQVKWLGRSRPILYEHLRRGGQAMVVANHTNAFDPLAIAGLMSKFNDVFKPMRRTTNGLVKVELMPSVNTELGNTDIESIKRRATRFGIHAMRSFPVHRPKDRKATSNLLSQEKRREERLFFIEAGRATEDFVEIKLKQGEHFAGFPEGERNLGDPRSIQTLFAAMGGYAVQGGEIAPEGFMVATLGLAYLQDSEGKKDRRHPTIVLAEPFSVEGMKSHQVKDRMADVMQLAVDEAWALQDRYCERNGLYVPRFADFEDTGGLA